MLTLNRQFSWSRIKTLHNVINFKAWRKHSTTGVGSANVKHAASGVTRKPFIKKGPGLEYFLYNNIKPSPTGNDEELVSHKVPYINDEVLDGTGKKVFVEVYGCQMNVNDTEIVYSILSKHNYTRTSTMEDASIVLIMTCAIREGAERKIWQRLRQLKAHKEQRKMQTQPLPLTVGLIGCMAERLKDQLIEKEGIVDVIAGPDSYRSLPYLLSQASSHQAAIDVILSLDETYADVVPVRLNPNSPAAYVSIMRGCDNMCSYCIVPFTRGKERSRPIDSIIDEIRHLSDQGIKEITLLGQNVNSYRDTSDSVYFGAEPAEGRVTSTAPGFGTVYKAKIGGRRFADLLDKVSLVNPEMRIRFMSPHPKDFPEEVLQLISERPNICKSLHLPAQSGCNRILSLMRRNYTREAYLNLVDRVLEICGTDVTLSSDFICGFGNETEEEFQETYDLVRKVGYTSAFIFPYSVREKTTAHRRLVDHVSLATKNDRVDRLVRAFREEADRINKLLIGSTQLVLVEGDSKRSDQFLVGRCDGNVRVIFPKKALARSGTSSSFPEDIKPGDYVAVKVSKATSQVLIGSGLYKTSLVQFYGDAGR